jgi:2-polyprenyl-3-methyl-5-hydroxy-6-metoxy-1,4-benzoquinol methylase
MKMSDIMDEGKEVPEIMSLLREKMRLKGSSHQASQEISGASDIELELAHIESEWDVQNKSYQIHSHRPFAGKILVKSRELIHGEVQRYVDPMINKQVDFNRNVSAILDHIVPRMENAEKSLVNARTEIQSQVDSITSEMDSKIDKKISGLLGEMKEDIENKAWLASILERRKASRIIPDKDQSKDFGINYFLFEERFRGPREDIKGKQQGFVQFFSSCRNVLDIGCGRGEFLELLKENGVEAKGIDIDPDMVGYCTSKGLNVELKDAISYLETIGEKALDGIFLDQVVEHLEPEYLTKLLDLCYKKLNYGYFIILETVNPLSLFSFINFYIDMTHMKPLHPDTLKFLLTAVGFRDIEAQFFAPIADEVRLKRLENNEETTDKAKKFVTIYNHNTDILNNILFGPQDYAIIGKK